MIVIRKEVVSPHHNALGTDSLLFSVTVCSFGKTLCPQMQGRRGPHAIRRCGTILSDITFLF